MSIPFIGADQIRALLSYAEAVTVLEDTFASDPLPDSPPRTRVERDGSLLLLMPAWDDDAAGVKLVTVNESNPGRGLPLIHGVYVLFSGETLAPIALFDAAELTALRTAAVSALATKYLASPDAARLLVFGAGVQAEAHIRALDTVRSLEEVTIVARNPAGAAHLVERLVSPGFAIRAGTGADVEDADLICTCTTSSEPLFSGALLSRGAHVNAIGAHTPTTREVDEATVARSYVVVETRESAMAEAGDLLIPLSSGAVSGERVPAAELGQVVRGQATPPGDRDTTLFKSVGVAFEDLAVARAIFSNS